jgi:heavy metal sensor kinase
VRALSIRARFTLFYSAMMALFLILFSAGVLWLESRWMHEQFDVELGSINQTLSRVLDEELNETADLEKAAYETREVLAVAGWATAVLHLDGQPIVAHWNGFPGPTRASPTVTDVGMATTAWQGRTWRTLVTRHRAPSGDYLIFVGGDLERVTREQRFLTRVLLAATPLIVLLAAATCWWLASSALEPVTTMARQADSITATSPDRRLDLGPAADEVTQMGRSFNRLLDRLGSALEVQRQFMADASHELRTPVSVVRTAAEVTLGHAHRQEGDYRDALAIVHEQSVRLTRMVEGMLALARADADAYPVRPELLYLDDIVADCIAAAVVLAEPRGIVVTSRLSRDLATTADDALLRQLVTNLLLNAIQYTPDGGRVDVALSIRGQHALIEVADTGRGIPRADRERVFDRFVRLDPARSGETGAGLGLPIARWIAQRHGGTVTSEDSPLGSGCLFVVTLPLTAGSPGGRRPGAESGAGGQASTSA